MKFFCTDFHGVTPIVTRKSFRQGMNIPIKFFLAILIISYLPHFANAQCTCSSDSGSLSWSLGDWPDGSMNENFTITAPGEDPLDIDIQFSTAAQGSFYNFGRNWPIIDAPGGLNYFGASADVGVVFNPNFNQGGIPIVIDVTFDRPVTCVSFEVSDIDISGADRKDQVIITSDVGNPTLSLLGTNPTVAVSGNTANATGTGGNSGASSSDNDGSIIVDFEGLAVSTVTITYNEISGNADPAGRGIGLFGQFSVCPAEVRGSISGTVLEDIDGDGIGDNAVPVGTVIELLDELGNPVMDDMGVPITTTTVADGTYSFTGLLLDTYQVQEQDPTGFSSVSDTDGGDANVSTVTLSTAQLADIADFTDEQPVSISGTVLEDTDGDGVGDVPVPAGTAMALLDGNGDPVLDDSGMAITTTTDAGGGYTFSNISPGDYQVEENDPSDYTSVSDTDGGDPDNTVVSPAPGEDLMNVDFVDEQSGSISGTVFSDTDGDGTGDAPISEGVEITLLNELGDVVLDDSGNPFVTTTATDGTYLFEDVPPGTYQVVETNVFGYDDVSDTDGGDANNTNVVVGAGQSVENIDFTDVKVGAIAGTLLEDIDGDGIGDDPEPGLVVALLYSDETPVLDGNGVAVETTTDADGNYSFEGVLSGDYLVQATDPTDFNSVSDTDGGDENQTSVNIVGVENVLGIDFIDEEPGSISGSVFEDIDGDGVGDIAVPEGSVVTLLDENGDFVSSTTTDTNGAYTFPDLSPSNYEVVESDGTGYSSVSDTDGGDPNSTNVSILPGGDITDIDFVDEQPVSISGTVWEDTNGDGVGDIPVPVGTVVSLLDGGGSPVLDDLGNPMTTTTAADGTYSFTGLTVGNYVVVESNPLGYSSVSDTDGGKPDRTSVSTSPGDVITGIDFIDEQQGSISGVVLIDTNGDGAGDTPAPAGTQVSLLDSAGDPIYNTLGVPITTATAADGSYTFLSLSPGDYQVEEIDPSNHTSVSDTDGGDDNLTSVTLPPGTDLTGVDFVDAPSYNISGTIFNDGNGLMDNYINGMGISNPSSTQLYVTLLNDLGDYVADVPVNADGTYAFTGVVDGTYTVQLNDPSSSPGLPTGWENTGEYIGGSAGSDGAVDGQISVTVASANVTDVNFGIQVIPVADDFTEPEQSNPGSTAQVAVPSLSGTDFEDGVKGAGDDIVIQTLPNDATLYYAGQPVTAGQVITSYNPSLLTIDPIDGTVTASFTYSFIDDAGKESEPATVIMPFLGSLPIELFDFSVVKNGREVILKWATASERDNDYFEIERSANGVDFMSLYKIDGNGTTTTSSYYNYTDGRPMSGHNYYRIKQVDHDQRFSYSEVKSVSFGYRGEVNVYPNPTLGVLTIDSGSQVPYLLQVYAADGKLVKKLDSSRLNAGQLIDISSLNAGYYYFKFVFENGTVESKQVQLVKTSRK